MKIRVNTSDVFKRSMSLMESHDSSNMSNCMRYYEQAKRINGRGEIVKFIKECGKSPEAAIKYIRPCIMFLEEYSDDKEISNIFMDEIISRIPDIELSDIIGSNINDTIREAITIQLKKNKVCDRILENHSRIKAKYDMDSFVSKWQKSLSNDFIIETCCRVVDSFNMKPYAKVNTAIEESMFLLESNQIKYKDNDMVNAILKYYLCKENSVQDIEDMMRVVKENYCVEYTEVGFKNGISSIVDKFLSSPDKNEVGLSCLVTSVMNTTPFEISINFPLLLDVFHKLCIINSPLCQTVLIQKIIPSMMDLITKMRDLQEYRNILKVLCDHIQNEIELVSIHITQIDTCAINSEEITNNLISYKSAITDLCNGIKDELDFAYTGYNIECMSQYNSFTEASNILTLNEFKLFKFNNLLNSIRKVDMFLQKKLHSVYNKSKGKLKHIKSKIFDEMGVYDCIDESGFIDCCIATFKLDSMDGIAECHDILSDVCKEINHSTIIRGTRSTVYYEIYGNEAQIRMRDNTIVSLMEAEEIDQYEKHITAEDFQKIVNLINVGSLVDSIDDNMDILDTAKEAFIQNPDPALFNLFIEAASLSNIDASIIGSITESITTRYPAWKSDFYYGTLHTVSSYEPVGESFDLQLEAYSILQSILEDVKSKDPSKMEKTNKKISSNNKQPEQSKNIDGPKVSGITNVKLYLQGLKKKTMDLSAKEKEISRNADTTFNLLIKSIKQALVSDRRESIIKGSVIPSFSKSMKIAIVLAGIAKLANPGAAIITAIGGLALSKNLTKKERALLLDEIEIELEMVEKEIQIAESRNQLKKVRKLMMMKKNLQRQYQSIKLNIRVGKDIIPRGEM